MKDFNFFESYLRPTKTFNFKAYTFALLAVLVFVLLGANHLRLLKQYRDDQKTLDAIIEYNESAMIVSKLQKVDKLQSILSNMEMTFLTIQSEVLEIENKESFDDMYLEKVNAQIPEGVFMIKSDFTEGQCNIQGFSNSYEGISQFVFNLRSVFPNYEVTLDNVQNKEGELQFAVGLMKLMEVIDEAK